MRGGCGSSPAGEVEPLACGFGGHGPLLDGTLGVPPGGLHLWGGVAWQELHLHSVIWDRCLASTSAHMVPTGSALSWRGHRSALPAIGQACTGPGVLGSPRAFQGTRCLWPSPCTHEHHPAH